MVPRALLPAYSCPAVSAAGARAAVLSFHLPERPLSPQFSSARSRLYIFAAYHAGLCLDVSPRPALGGRQSTLASDRRSAGSGPGGRWVQTPSGQFLRGTRGTIAISAAVNDCS